MNMFQAGLITDIESIKNFEEEEDEQLFACTSRTSLDLLIYIQLKALDIPVLKISRQSSTMS
jgi:hypothetical protein